MIWLCLAICEVRLWPYRCVCAVAGHKPCGNDCFRCGSAL